MKNGEFIFYTTEDGQSKIDLLAENNTVWLTQADMAELFDKGKATISEHISNIFQEQELPRDATVRKFRTVQAEGTRQVERELEYYSLDMILAVGFRVRSPRGVQFRRWANTVLKEYLVKGFAMDDKRLKQAENWDYFDEWLARIRDIRASEKRFYQKIKELYTTAVDYEKTSGAARLFFKKVQNKMLWAVTGHTAAELIAARADPAKPNMGLTAFKGSIVRKADVDTAKNYLQKDEIDELNRIVTMYLDYAEDQAKKRRPVTMAQWAEKLDAFLQFNERELLTDAGKLSAAVAKQLAERRYEAFDKQRKQAEAQAADAADIKELEALAEELTGKAP